MMDDADRVIVGMANDAAMQGTPLDGLQSTLNRNVLAKLTALYGADDGIERIALVLGAMTTEAKITTFLSSIAHLHRLTFVSFPQDDEQT